MTELTLHARIWRSRTLWGAGGAVLCLMLLGATALVADRATDGQLRYWLREESPVVSPLYAELQSLLNPPLSPAELGEGANARDLRLLYPSGMATDAEGNVYVADRGQGANGRIVWRITPEGLVERVLGNGQRGLPEHRSPARETSLGSPEGLRVDQQGRLYVVDSAANVVLRVEVDGTLTVLAGTADLDGGGYSGDGGPAGQGELNAPYDIAIDDFGNVFIADFGNHRVRKVAPDGTIETVAGTGRPGYTGDGGSATAAQLNGPYGVAVDSQQRLLIADSLNHVIRRVDESGTITTIAGSGIQGYSGDGGPALEAAFDAPQALLVDDAGNIYIGDEHNHAIRLLKNDGTIEGIVGIGSPGMVPAGTALAEVMLDDPEMVALLNGQLLVVENENGRIVRITDERLEVFAGRSR